MDTDARVRGAVEMLAKSIPVSSSPTVHVETRRDMRRWLLPVAAAMVAVLAGIVLVARSGPDRKTKEVVTAASYEWKRVDDGPPVDASTGVWLRDRLVVAGPSVDAGPGGGVAASWTRDQGWSSPTTIPLSGTDGVRLIAAGDRVVAYDEREAAVLSGDGVWRAVPSPTLPRPHRALAALWTGDEVLVWGELLRGESSNVGIALDPATGEWRPLPPAPVGLNQGEAAWDGREMVVVGSHLDTSNAPDGPSGSVAMAYAPATNTWRQLADPQLSPQAASVAWTGTTLIAWDYVLRVSRYDPAENSWSSSVGLPFKEAECVPQSAVLDEERVLLHYCGQAAVIDARTGVAQPMAMPSELIDSIEIDAPGQVALIGTRRARGLWILEPNTA